MARYRFYAFRTGAKATNFRDPTRLVKTRNRMWDTCRLIKIVVRSRSVLDIFETIRTRRIIRPTETSKRSTERVGSGQSISVNKRVSVAFEKSGGVFDDKVSGSKKKNPLPIVRSRTIVISKSTAFFPR